MYDLCLGSVINGAIWPFYAIIFSEVVALFYKPPNEIDDDLPMWISLFVGIGIFALVANLLQQTGFATSSEYLTQRLRYETFKVRTNHYYMDIFMDIFRWYRLC
jgi:ATP-binding cassette subfamily B (MDR/TAP) protein 1